MAGAPKLVAIDDELEFTKTLEQFFSARGFQVRVALTGTSGLALVEAERPDVALVDLKLPGLDGDELLRRIRAELKPGRYRARVQVTDLQSGQVAVREKLFLINSDRADKVR